MAGLTYDEELYLRKSLADFGIPTSELELNYIRDSFAGTGSQTIFTLSRAPSSTFQIFVLLNGVLQKSPEIWSLSGLTLTFLVAPSSSIPILVVYEY